MKHSADADDRTSSPPSALIDFRAPGAQGRALRLAFAAPRETLLAHRIDEVASVLMQAEQRARAGAWCVGYLHYEAAAAFDSALRTQPATDEAGPLARFMVYDAPLAGPQAELAWQACDTATARIRWSQYPERAAFDTRFATLMRGIEAGEFYQVNLCDSLEGEFEGDPLGLFGALRRAQPKAYAAYLAADGLASAVLSVSPELFFSWRDGRLLACPMKGTAPRGANPAEDAAAMQRLQSSEKERAENVMIVDLLRNDLSRIAQPFSVKVPQLFQLEAWPTVWQMSSEIECQTRPGLGLTDVFAALFPCGSVTGAPKVQAMRTIAALEAQPRGVYCGAVGLIEPGGATIFNVPIRTLELRQGRVRCGIGSGITAGANSADEWREWRHKRAFAERASEAFELLETLGLRDGVAVHANAHRARMLAAAAHFDFALQPTDFDAALATLASQHPSGHWRLRLLCDRLGTVRGEAFAMALPDPAAVVQVQLADSAIEDCEGEFFRFKTTRRAHYEAFAPTAPERFDALLWNERGELTEFTRGNVAVLLDGVWLTPPLHCGLLPGIARAHLLEQGRLREAVVLRSDLERAQGLAFFNSLRGWLEVSLVEP